MTAAPITERRSEEELMAQIIETIDVDVPVRIATGSWRGDVAN
ncbi:hypothetical protein [Microbacterium hominis]|nr:hypothetical protein [Microbacterium hominis]